MITLIGGGPGVGKTKLLTHFATEYLSPPLSDERLWASQEIVEELNEGGFHITNMPNDHLVFADYDIVYKSYFCGERKSYEVDGFYLGLPNKQHPTVFHPPYSAYFLSEAQKYYNSRMSHWLADFISRFYEAHRHYYLDIFLDCQRGGLIDLNIRDIAARCIEVLGHKDKRNRRGEIIKTVWDCLVFEDTKLYDQYLKTGNREGGRIEQFVHHGDIEECYETRNQFPAFLKDRENQNFDIKQSDPTELRVESIRLFNEVHKSTVPATYYKVSPSKVRDYE